MNQVNCTNCGASVFSNVDDADDDQPDISVYCQYCGSQFEISNPNYRPPAGEVNIYNTYNYNVGYRRGYRYYRSYGWKDAPDWQHKFAKLAGYIAGGLAVPFAIIMWVTAFMPGTDMPVGVPVAFSLLILGIFMLARASAKELQRRHGNNQSQVNKQDYTKPVKKTPPTQPVQNNMGIPLPPPGSLVKVTPKWLLTAGMIFGYLGVAGTSYSIIAGLLNKHNETIHKVFGVAFLVLIFMMPLYILGRRCQVALQRRIAEEKAAAERWEQQSKTN